LQALFKKTNATLLPRRNDTMTGLIESFPTGDVVQTQSIYAQPRTVTDPESCFFYHTIDIPGYGTKIGEWDLRRGVDRYLGKVDLTGKRVLEMGTANGFLCFEMERRGADVVAVDLSEEHSWDLVPFAKYEAEEDDSARKSHVRRTNNAWWLGHAAFGSRARVVYTPAYSVPEQIGAVDIATFGSILLHLRDPFHALWNASRLTRETVIVTDLLFARDVFPFNMLDMFQRPAMRFAPNPKTGRPYETWWRLNPEIIKRFLGVLGFESTTVTYHYQLSTRRRMTLPVPMFTVVGHRTAGRALEQ
jgi:SAM-dependent methyltransferase